MEKEKKMVMVITQNGGTTHFERIGDNLEKELRGWVLRELEGEMHRAKIIN